MANGGCKKTLGFAIFHLTFAIQDAFFRYILLSGSRGGGPQHRA